MKTKRIANGAMIMLVLLLFCLVAATASADMVAGGDQILIGSAAGRNALPGQLLPRHKQERYAPERRQEVEEMKAAQEEEAVGTVSFYCYGEVEGHKDRMSLGEAQTLYRRDGMYYLKEALPQAYIDYFGNSTAMPDQLDQWSLRSTLGYHTGTLDIKGAGEDAFVTLHFDDWEAVADPDSGVIEVRVVAEKTVPLVYVDVSMPLYFEQLEYANFGNWYYVTRGGSINDYQGHLTDILGKWEKQNASILKGWKFTRWRDGKGQPLTNVQEDVKLMPVYAGSYVVELWDSLTRTSIGYANLFSGEAVAVDSLPIPQKDGYVFAGWTTALDRRNASEAPPVIQMEGENVRLYASYKKLIPVVFEGALSRQTVMVPEGTLCGELRAAEPELLGGATFSRWLDKSTGREASADKKVTENMTFKAEYLHTVTFMLGDEVYDEQQVVAGRQINQDSIKSVAEDGIRFYQWVAQDEGDSLSMRVTRNMVFEAQVAYRVRFVYGIDGESVVERYVMANQRLNEGEIPQAEVDGFIESWDPDAMDQEILSPIEFKAAYTPIRQIGKLLPFGWYVFVEGV